MKKRIASKITLKLLMSLFAAFLLCFLIVLVFTFTVTKPRMEKSMLNDAVHTGQQLSEELDRILNSMCDTAAFCASYPNLMSAIQSMEEGEDTVVSVLTELCANPYLDVKAAVIVDENRRWASEYNYTYEDERAVESPTILSLSEERPGPYVAVIYTSAQENDTLNIGTYLRSDSGRGYRLVLLFDAVELKELITQTLSYDYTGFEIGKSYGPGFFHGGQYADSHEILQDNQTPGNEVLKKPDGYYIISQTEHNWRICGYVSNEDFAARYMPSVRNAVGLCCLMFVLFILATLPILNSILKPIRSLKDDMTAAANGNLEIQTEIRSYDEIGQLGQYFNEMIVEIRERTEDRIRAEAAELNLRQSLLLSQVNYHFLYNSMSSINALARRQDYEKIILVNTALVDILQSNMVLQNAEMMGVLSEELKVVQDYWTIQKISLRGTAELAIDCPEELTEYVVPRSILQPLVENSLRHGLIDEETGEPAGRVDISVSRAAGILEIVVADDGRGIAPETLLALDTVGDSFASSGRHIGISNIRKRLEYLYKGAATLKIENKNGTIITMRIPMA